MYLGKLTMLNLSYFVHGCKTCAFNACLKSASYGHHHKLGIFPGEALPDLHWNHLQFLFVSGGVFAFSLVFNKWKACSVGSRTAYLLPLFKNSVVALALCLGSLSCCKVKRPPMSLDLSTCSCMLQNSFCCCHQVPSMRKSEPVPVAVTLAQVITLPQPCFTMVTATVYLCVLAS